MRSVIFIALLLGALPLPSPLRANAAPVATFTVNSIADKPDANPGDGVCATASDKCTLRAAIMEANANANKDVINLPAGNYVLKRVGNDNNALWGDLDIRHKLDLIGAGADITTIDGNGSVTFDRVFTIIGFSMVKISGVHILFGAPTGNGGGIYNAGNLTLENSFVSGNSAKKGGGIYNTRTKHAVGFLLLQGSTLWLNTARHGGGIFNKSIIEVGASTLKENKAQNDINATGGGISNHGEMGLYGVVVKDNEAELGGGVFHASAKGWLDNATVEGNHANQLGGGIYTQKISPIQPGTKLSVTFSTIRNNTASDGGGGINNTATLELADSTVSGNHAENIGGGIGGGGDLSVTNSTISGNTAKISGGGVGFLQGIARFFNVTVADNTADSDGDGTGIGGGILVDASLGPLLGFQNTLIANNWNYDQRTGVKFGDNCAGELTSFGYNLVHFPPPTCSIVSSTTGNITNQDAMIDILANNGGPTLTHRLESASPAIDAGDPAGCKGLLSVLLTTDQRGEPRPTDGDGRDGPRCDIGAFEK